MSDTTHHCVACLGLVDERANLSRALDTIYGERDEAVAHLRAVLRFVPDSENATTVKLDVVSSAQRFVAGLDKESLMSDLADEEGSQQ